MTKLNAAFITNKTDFIEYVYGEEKIKQISEMVNLNSTIITQENIKEQDLENIDILFSTWGIFSPEPEVLARFKNLKIVFYGAGATDHFFHTFNKIGVKVISSWMANAVPVAEFCVAQILLGLKNYFNVSRQLKHPDYWNNNITGPGCYGETVTLIGNGAIATLVAKMLIPYNLKIITIPARVELRTTTLEEAFSKSQVVSNHLPDRDDNVGV